MWPAPVAGRSRPRRALALAALLALLSIGAADDPDAAARSAVRAALDRWSAAFNARDPAGSCALFAPDLIATFPGGPDRDYGAMCRQLTAVVRDRTRSLRYSFELEEIVVRGDLAVVRLVWTLRSRDATADRETVEHERGVDVFRLQPDGSWRISRSMAYPEEAPPTPTPGPSADATRPAH